LPELLNIPSLQERRIHLKLGLLYKIIHSLCYFPDDIFEFRPNHHSRSTNPLTLKQPFARTNAFYYSFVPHTISLWNSLSSSQVTATSLASFKQLIWCTNYLLQRCSFVLLCFLAFVVCSSCISYLHLVGIHPISLRLLLYVQYTCTNFYRKKTLLLR